MHLEPHHVGIIASDMDRSTAFYEALGFETTMIFDSPDASRIIKFMRLGGLMIELFWYAEECLPAPSGGRRLGFRHLALRTDDIAQAAAELQSKGLVGEGAEISTLPNGVQLLFFEDPDGVEIEVQQEA